MSSLFIRAAFIALTLVMAGCSSSEEIADPAIAQAPDAGTATTTDESLPTEVLEPVPTPTADIFGTTDGSGDLGATMMSSETDVCPLVDDQVVLGFLPVGEAELVIDSQSGIAPEVCRYLGGMLDIIMVGSSQVGGPAQRTEEDFAEALALMREAEIEPVTVEGATDAVFFSTDDLDEFLDGRESSSSQGEIIAGNQTGGARPPQALAAHDGEQLVLVYVDVSAVEDKAAAASEIAAAVFGG